MSAQPPYSFGMREAREPADPGARSRRRLIIWLIVAAVILAGVVSLALYGRWHRPKLLWSKPLFGEFKYTLRRFPTRDTYYYITGEDSFNIYSYQSDGSARWRAILDSPLVQSSGAFKTVGDCIAVVCEDGSSAVIRSNGEFAFKLKPGACQAQYEAGKAGGAAAAFLYQTVGGSYGLNEYGLLQWSRSDLQVQEPAPRFAALEEGQLLAVDQSGPGASIVALSPDGKELWRTKLPRPEGAIGEDAVAVSELVPAGKSAMTFCSVALSAYPTTSGMSRYDEKGSAEVSLLKRDGSLAWQLPATLQYWESPLADSAGNIYYSQDNLVFRVDPEGKQSRIINTGGAQLLRYGLTDGGLPFAETYSDPLAQASGGDYRAYGLLRGLGLYKPSNCLNVFSQSGRLRETFILAPQAFIVKVNPDGRAVTVYDGETRRLERYAMPEAGPE